MKLVFFPDTNRKFRYWVRSRRTIRVGEGEHRSLRRACDPYGQSGQPYAARGRFQDTIYTIGTKISGNAHLIND